MAAPVKMRGKIKNLFFLCDFIILGNGVNTKCLTICFLFIINRVALNI